MRHVWLAGCAFLLVTPAAARGQARFELGVDAGIGVTNPATGPTQWFASVPLRRVRLGIRASDRIAVEPNLASVVSHIANSTSWDLRAGVDVRYHPAGHTGVRPYLATGVTLVRQWARTGGVGGSTTQVLVGGSAGIGLRLASQLALRTEVHFDHGFGTPVVTGFDQVVLRVGPSFLTP